MEIQQDIPLAPFTTLGVGGAARYFVELVAEHEVAEALNFAKSANLPTFVLGGGSNVLISDEGFSGLVIKIGLGGIREHSGVGDKVRVTAGAGEIWDGFVEYCVERGLAGVECLSGIPGLVGGTPIQNVGAYGQDVSGTIQSVRCFDRTTGKIVVLSPADCEFSYRKSIFNSTHRGRYVITSVTLQLARHGAPDIKYRELQERFTGGNPALRTVREEVLAIRRRKSMVIDAGDPNSRSVGSFFKNPIVTTAEHHNLEAAHGPMPSFSADSGVKLSAAWLIENSGVQKGFKKGEAGVSANHTLALIAIGRSNASAVLELKEFVQERVGEKFGIWLEPEPVMVGFSQ